MRKVLIGVLVVCISLGLASAAMADFTTNSGGQVVFGVYGDDGPTCDFYFGGGDIELWYQVMQTCGPWGAEVKVSYDTGEEDDGEIYVRSASLWYDGGTWKATAFPNGVDSGVFDIENCDGGMPGIPCNPGIMFETTADTLDVWLKVNNQCCPPCGSDELVWNFAGGAGFNMDGLGIDFVYNSDQGPKTANSWGVKGTYSMDQLALTGEYGSYTGPWGAPTGNGWYLNGCWNMDTGDSLSVTYMGADANFNDRPVPWSKNSGEYTHVLDSCVSLVLGAASVSGCDYHSIPMSETEYTADTSTSWWAKIVCSIG